MTVHSTENSSHSIYINAIILAYLNSAKSKLLGDLMDDPFTFHEP